jgi:hypothetical protein
VRLKVDVIVTQATPPTLAAKQATAAPIDVRFGVAKRTYPNDGVKSAGLKWRTAAA